MTKLNRDIINDLIIIADQLDKKGLFKDADVLDQIVKIPTNII